MERMQKEDLSTTSTEKSSSIDQPTEKLSSVDLPTEKSSSIDQPTEKSPSIDLPTEKLSSIDLPTEELPSTQVKNSAGNTQKRTHLVAKGICVGAFILVAICGVLYAYVWSISTSNARSEIFTELYIEDNVHLPSKVIPKHPYYFQFTLHNLEGKDMEYPYEVYLEVGQEKVVFDRGTLFVKENSYKTIQERFATSSVLPRSEVVVNLVNKNQQVDFWIEGAS